MSNCETGIILVNTGTPDAPTPEAVKKYLAQFLMDDHIRPMNKLAWSIILHACILPSRSKKSAAKYAKIWTPEGAPLAVYMSNAARALETQLSAAGKNVSVAWASTYGNPSIEAAFCALIKKGASNITVLPMYPQSAYSTTSCVKDAVFAAQKKCHYAGKLSIVENYHNNSAYIRAVANSIAAAGFDAARGDQLIMSYHSIPLVDIENGDTYKVQTENSSALIAEALGIFRTQWQISYQCRFDKQRTWVSPFTSSVLDALAAENATAAQPARVFIVCPNFSIDCLETIFDVQQCFAESYVQSLRQKSKAEVAKDAFNYVPCLNDSPAQIATLQSVLAPYI